MNYLEQLERKRSQLAESLFPGRAGPARPLGEFFCGTDPRKRENLEALLDRLREHDLVSLREIGEEIERRKEAGDPVECEAAFAELVRSYKELIELVRILMQ